MVLLVWVSRLERPIGRPNTLVLLQGDGLSRYIRVQAVQLGDRSLSATTPSERAWGTQRTSFGPVLEIVSLCWL